MRRVMVVEAGERNHQTNLGKVAIELRCELCGPNGVKVRQRSDGSHALVKDHRIDELHLQV